MHMKKYLLVLLATIATVTMSLNAQTMVLNEGFEDGIQDAVWTQEFVSGQTPWAVESVSDNLSYPATVRQGTHRAYLRNNTGETLGYATRLVSRVMDLSPRKVYQPELTFWYANPRWGADRDTLRVLYRTSANGKWKQLGEYSSGVSDWQKVNMSLPEVGATYQIAFEGKDNLGRGIVLDSITIRSAPECTVPHDLVVNNKGAGRVNLSWVASWDAYNFEVVISRDTIDPDTLSSVPADKIAYHELIDGMQQNCNISLESGQFYLAYVRSLCDRETSVWSSQASKYGPFGFLVRPTLQIPYSSSFTLPADLKSSQWNPEWARSSNTGHSNPFINSKTTSATTLGYYSYDKSSCMVFSGGTTASAVIPAGSYVLAATPALTDSANAEFSLNQCQVHFWSTVYIYTGRNYARSLIVGVMNDPEDITTFVPVDTVSVWGNKTFQENYVDLSTYKGDGSYVAFVSDFDRQNLFYIDDVTVEYHSPLRKVTQISVNPRDTYAQIEWEGNASSYEVLVTNAEVDPSSPDAASVVDRATVNSNSYRCDQLEPDRTWNAPYYVYVKAEGTEWSYRYPFVTITPMRAIPYTFDFESASGRYKMGSSYYPKNIGVFGNNPSYPYQGSTNSYKGSNCLFLNKNAGTDAWVTLPMVEDLDSVQVKFYLSGANTYIQSHAVVGVMSNPMDINTFVPVADFTLNTSGYSMCYANFENYSGPKDGVIAIMWGDVMNMSKNTINYIDELRVEKLSDCVPPTNVRLEVASDSITAFWDESSADTWEVAVSRYALTAAQKDMSFAAISALSQVVIADTVHWDGDGAPVFGFGRLNSQCQYYFYMRTICGNDAAWWTEIPFETPCPYFDFPYTEDFEAYNTNSTSFGCWKGKDYLGIGYPMIYSGYSSTSKSLELSSTGTTHRSVAIMPDVEGDLSDMLLCFETRSMGSYSTSVLYVGTMDDINDANSFVPFDTILNPSNGSVTKVRLELANYNLAHDHIAFSSGLGNLRMNSDVLVDNIELKDPSCIDPYDMNQIVAEESAFEVSWKGRSATGQWQIKVLTTDAALSNNRIGAYPTSAVVVNDSIINGDTLRLEGLEPTTTYYIFVRALCGDSLWTKGSATTECLRLDPSLPNKETFESYPAGGSSSYDNYRDYQAPCWTSGNMYSSYPSAEFMPYIYNSAPYATSGTKSYRLHADEEYSWWSTSPIQGPAYLITPRIKCDSLNDLVLTFSCVSHTTSYLSRSLIIGAVTNPNDMKTFVALDSIVCTTSPATYTIDFSDRANLLNVIPKSARYLAWRTPYDEAAMLFIDDVSITRMSCPIAKPSISALTENSVRVNSGIREDDTQWVLLITTSRISSDDLNREGYVIPAEQIVYLDTIDTRSVMVAGLENRTDYYLAAASLCDSVASLWNMLSFTTPCGSVTPEELGVITFSDAEGYTAGSGNKLPCWTTGCKSGESDDYIPYVENSVSHNGNRSLRMYDYMSSSSSSYNPNHTGAYAIMPKLNVDSISHYQVSFWGRGESSSYSTYNSQVIVGIVTDPSDLNTFVAVDTVTMEQSAWGPFAVGFESYEGDYMGDLGTNIMFLSEFGITNYAYITEISVEEIPACRSIGTFTVDSIGEHAAIVSWKGHQDSYRLLVADRDLQESEKATYHYLIDSIVDHSNRVRISGLNAATSYYIYAQGICGEGDTTAISVRRAFVRTECPVSNGLPLPFMDDFETYSSGENAPGCWIFSNDGNTIYPEVQVVSSNSSKAVDLYTTSSGHSLCVLPRLEGNLIDLQLSFDARTYSTSASSEAVLFVGTIADPLDPTTFVTIDQFMLHGSEEFSHFTMTLADYNLTHEYLAFTSGLAGMDLGYSSSTSDVYLDNVVLEVLSTCHAPRLRAGEITYNTVEVELIPNNPAHRSWDVVIIPDSVYSRFSNIRTYLDTTRSIITVNSTKMVFSGLEQATPYCVLARTHCGGEDGDSDWNKEPLRVHTAFYYKDSYYFGFEKNGERWERSRYSATDANYIHPALVTGRDTLSGSTTTYSYYPYSIENTTVSNYAHTGLGALNMYGANTYYGGYVIFPAIDEPKARSFEFMIRPGAVSTMSGKPVGSYDGVVEIGVSDRNKNFENYSPLATVRLEALAADAVADSENEFLFQRYSIDIDETIAKDKQLVLHLPKQSSAITSLYIDNVSLSEPKGYSLVSIRSIETEGESALIQWDSIGGPWNLVIYDLKGATPTELRRYDHISVTSMTVENLEPRANYMAYLEAVNVPAHAECVTSTSMRFSTTCRVSEPDENGVFSWNFDDPDEWEPNDVLAGSSADTAYLKPGCFTVGITYPQAVNGYQWLIQRKGYDYYSTLTNYSASRHIEVGRNDSHSLRVHTSASNFNSYIVLPELNCQLDTMMIEFYGRCFANYDATYTTASSRGTLVGTSYLGASYCQSIVVGTVENPNDLSTLQIIDTLSYHQTNLTSTDNVNNDPAGLDYWELMQLPLTRAQGKHIVLLQPAYGLFFIDDLSIKPVGNTIFAPSGVQTSAITANTATLVWRTLQPQYEAVVVVLDAANNEVVRDTVSGSSYVATGLRPATNYHWYAYITHEGHNSPASASAAFATECVTVSSDYATGFEVTEGAQPVAGQSSAALLQTLCWTYGDALQNGWSSSSYDPYNQPNSDTYLYSHTDSFALVMRASYSTSSYSPSYQPYAAMPQMDVRTYDTLQVSFWMRPGYVRRAGGRIATAYTGGSYSKSIIVGTMTDPTDPTTFVAIDTVGYEGTLSTTDEANEANHYLFQQKKVELAGAKGAYVAFMTSFHEKGSDALKSSDYIWIDDVAITRAQDCKDPKNLTVDEIGSTFATVSWDDGGLASDYRMQVSTDLNFANEDAIIFDGTVHSNPYTIGGLKSQTSYAWRVQNLCGGDKGESEFSPISSFTTARSPFYIDRFESSTLNGDWIFSVSHADAVVDAAVAPASGNNSWGFRRVTNNYGLPGAHYAVPGYSNDYSWMITPSIYLPADDSVHLSFDLALTALNASHAITANAVVEDDMKDDFYFMVIVSEDGGNTWKSEHIIAKWQNTNAAGKQLRDIPSTGKTVRLSLAGFAGKNIRVGFYREVVSSSSTGIALHIDNVRMGYFDKEVEAASGCQYDDIQVGDIVLPGDVTEPGIHSYPTTIYASDADAASGVRDHVYALEIEVFPVSENVLNDTICEGESYNSADFHDKNQSGVYRRKLQTVEHGCDSIITLNLSVTPTQYAEETKAAICPGEEYIWNDKVYNRAGLFRDTLVSSLGCDSIETLIVSYTESSEDTIFVAERISTDELPYEYQNAEHPYLVGQTPITYPAGTQPGVYTATVLVQGDICTAVLVHTLTIYDPHEAIDEVMAGDKAARKIIYHDQLYIILNDEWYNSAGQKVADPRL